MRTGFIFFVFLFFATVSTQAQETNSAPLTNDSPVEKEETDNSPSSDTEQPKEAIVPIEDYLFTVQDDGRDIASAFLCKDEEDVWMVTSYHVIEGAEEIEFINMSDPDCTFSLPAEIQVAIDRDAIRFAVDHPDGLAISDTFSFGDEVVAFGNSDGRGVITRNAGEIIGMGSGEIEVDCAIIPGNSGGPVIDINQNVLGVAAYIVPSESEQIEDALKEAGAGERAMLTQRKAVLKGTRYGETRRFAVQIKDVTWQPVAQEELDAFYEVKLAVNDAFDTMRNVIYYGHELSVENGGHGKFLSSSWVEDYESEIKRKAEPYYNRAKQEYVCYYNVSDKTRKEWFNDLANAGRRRSRKIEKAIASLSATYLIDQANDLNNQLSSASDALKEISRRD
ncbi:MAG: trypsin-like peptidase domain-containing protein [Kiritimatiellales bacterium]|nr:trypsin-like peptidase domain-containing protein [Kiritimatiellota bacterium]MBL7011505.1 trypsin-like peptidase domain-containing protein [Kiritimatiellales bacterium]